MERKQILFFLSLAIAGLSLMASFYLSGHIILTAFSILPAGSMLYARKSPKPVIAHLSLAVFTLLSAIGLLADADLTLLVLALTAALASWDMVLEIHTLYPTTQKYEKQHPRYLAIALGAGLIGTSVLHNTALQLPFGGVLVLVIALVISLDQLLNYFQKSGQSNR